MMSKLNHEEACRLPVKLLHQVLHPDAHSPCGPAHVPALSSQVTSGRDSAVGPVSHIASVCGRTLPARSFPQSRGSTRSGTTAPRDRVPPPALGSHAQVIASHRRARQCGTGHICRVRRHIFLLTATGSSSASSMIAALGAVDATAGHAVGLHRERLPSGSCGSESAHVRSLRPCVDRWPCPSLAARCASSRRLPPCRHRISLPPAPLVVRSCARTEVPAE